MKKHASGYWYQFIIPRRLTLPPVRIYRWLNLYWRLKDKGGVTMTKEQEQAIKSLNEFSNTKYGGFTTKEGKTVLSLIKEQEEQLKKQDREIEELEESVDRLTDEQEEREKCVHGLEEKALDNIVTTDKENMQLKKQIDLMAEMIDELSEYYTRYWGKNNEFCKEDCIKKDIDCKDCIKQYFGNKVKGE